MGDSQRYNFPVKRAGLVSDLAESLPGLSFLSPDRSHPFVGAVQEVAERQMRDDALRDVRNAGIAGLGIGAGAAGLGGLVRSLRKKKQSPASQVLPLPIPVAADDDRPQRLGKSGADVSGISTRAGIPWYGPAMLFSGLAGAGAGWKGIDHVLKSKARRDREKELEEASGEFQEALLGQYSSPLKVPKSAADAELSSALDRLYDLTQAALEKSAVNAADVGGMAAGGYGAYAGLSGLLAGSIVYNQMKKRSRKAILEKALAKRERRRFAQSPPEIYAMPEPVLPAGPPKTPDFMKALKESPADA